MREALDAYDGRHPEGLERASVAGASQAAWVDELIGHARSTRATGRFSVSGAIWLIRLTQKRGGAFTREQVEAVCGLLTADRHWEQTLNLLQLIDSLGAAGRQRVRLRRVIRVLCEHERPLVRAWAMSVLIRRLGLDEPGARELVERGRLEGPASVRARIRRAEAEVRVGLGAP